MHRSSPRTGATRLRPSRSATAPRPSAAQLLPITVVVRFSKVNGAFRKHVKEHIQKNGGRFDLDDLLMGLRD